MKKKILIVDDETDMVDLVTLRLEAADYEVFAAYNGEEALEKAKTKNPDLILLDAILPMLDGFQVCRHLKKDTNLTKIPIIMFSALTRKEDLENFKKAKANAYITKPFDSKELLDTIKELIDKHE